MILRGLSGLETGIWVLHFVHLTRFMVAPVSGGALGAGAAEDRKEGDGAGAGGLDEGTGGCGGASGVWV
ncbi:MAG: hypothetical protein QXW06_06570, partial [Thermoplasmata archaeon]